MKKLIEINNGHCNVCESHIRCCSSIYIDEEYNIYCDMCCTRCNHCNDTYFCDEDNDGCYCERCDENWCKNCSKSCIHSDFICPVCFCEECFITEFNKYFIPDISLIIIDYL